MTSTKQKLKPCRGCKEGPPKGRSTRTHCRDCHRTWRELEAAHCTACHQHFSNVDAFETHQQVSHGRVTCLTGARR